MPAVSVGQEGSQRLVFLDKVVIGEIAGGAFIQHTTRRHLFRMLNSKGIEYDVYERLKHEPVKFWRLMFNDTKEIMEIPFSRIPQVGILDPPHSAGYQYHVKLQYFNERRAVLQKELL